MTRVYVYLYYTSTRRTVPSPCTPRLLASHTRTQECTPSPVHVGRMVRSHEFYLSHLNCDLVQCIVPLALTAIGTRKQAPRVRLSFFNLAVVQTNPFSFTISRYPSLAGYVYCGCVACCLFACVLGSLAVVRPSKWTESRYLLPMSVVRDRQNVLEHPWA